MPGVSRPSFFGADARCPRPPGLTVCSCPPVLLLSGQMDQEDGLDDDWHDAVVPPDDQMDDRLSVQTEKLDDEFSDVVIKSESGHVIANDTYDDEYNEYDEEDIPESPPFMDNESEDPDYSEDEMEADTEIDEPLPTRWPITILPEDADLDPVVELERIEEAVDEDGVGAKIWKCKLCDLRFQVSLCSQ